MNTCLLIFSLFLCFGTEVLTIKRSLRERELIVVTEHVWVEDSVIYNNSITMVVPNGMKFYNVMVKASHLDDDFLFISHICTGLGHFITQIGAFEQDPSQNLYWFLYVYDKPPDTSHPPNDSKRSPVGVSNLVVENGKHYLFWLRSATTAPRKSD